MRTNFRPVARAIDSPIDVLPVPGGPLRVSMAPEPRSSGAPRSARTLRRRRPVLAQLLADRVELAAEEVVALLLLCTRLGVVADALPHLQLRQPLALQAERQLEPLDHGESLEQLDLLGEREVGRVTRR